MSAIRRTYAPLYAGPEYPGAYRVARELVAIPALLSLCNRRLAADLMACRGMARTTAWRAVRMARRLGRGEVVL